VKLGILTDTFSFCFLRCLIKNQTLCILFYLSNQRDALLGSLFIVLYLFRVPFAPIIRST